MRLSPTTSKLSRLTALAAYAEPICILIVDDSRTVRISLRNTLEELPGVSIVQAETLAEAQILLRENPRRFFCAVLDLTLPDACGIEIVRLVSQYEVPIIVLTGSVDVEVRRAVLEQRVIDYVVKSNAGAIEEVAYLVGRLRQNLHTKVLVVDDSATFRTHLAKLLTQYCFIILTAANGREALDCIAKHPDTLLVLTDHYMPGMDGLELIRHLRRRYRREDLAIIALSGAEEPELSAAMIKAGANDFLSKHFLIEEFFCRVTQNVNMIAYVRQLEEMVKRDYLTGLFNRRHLFELGEHLHASAQRDASPIALAMIDIDYFKRINDTFGHDAGDKALQTLAAVLCEALPESDIVARFGGEEFICISLSVTSEQAAQRYEQLRQRIANLDLRHHGERIPLTASIGYTTQLGDSLSSMIARADAALYRAKEGGRNRVNAG